MGVREGAGAGKELAQDVVSKSGLSLAPQGALEQDEPHRITPPRGKVHSLFHPQVSLTGCELPLGGQLKQLPLAKGSSLGKR